MEQSENRVDPLKTEATIPHIKNKHTDDLVDHYWGSIMYVTSLIKASEIKAGLILSFYGILLNFIYQSMGMVLAGVSNIIVLYSILGLWLCAIVISIYFSIRCFIPRIESKFDKNIFFFRDVTSKFGTIQEFSNTFYTISKDEDQLFPQLGQQIFILSKIAGVKFKNVNMSLRFLAIGLLLLLVVVLYYSISTL